MDSEELGAKLWKISRMGKDVVDKHTKEIMLEFNRLNEIIRAQDTLLKEKKQEVKEFQNILGKICKPFKNFDEFQWKCHFKGLWEGGMASELESFNEIKKYLVGCEKEDERVKLNEIAHSRKTCPDCIWGQVRRVYTKEWTVRYGGQDHPTGVIESEFFVYEKCPRCGGSGTIHYQTPIATCPADPHGYRVKKELCNGKVVIE